jgi:hypothetical protein
MTSLPVMWLTSLPAMWLTSLPVTWLTSLPFTWLPLTLCEYCGSRMLGVWLILRLFWGSAGDHNLGKVCYRKWRHRKGRQRKSRWWEMFYYIVSDKNSEMYQRSYSVINRRRSLVDNQQLVKFINIFQPGSRLVRQFIFNLQLL